MTTSTLFVGIDVSKLKHDVAVVDEQKNILAKPLVISDSVEGYQQLLQTLTRLQHQHQVKLFKIGMEATGDYWKNIYHFLKKQSPAYELTVINPVQTRAYAKAELRRAKTDPVNAKDIACFMAEKKPKATTDKTAILDNIKDIDRQLYAIKKQSSMTINRLRIELSKVAPELEHAVAAIDGQQLLAVLAHYPTAALIKNASLDQLQAIRYGRKQWALPINFIMRLKQLTANSIAYKSGAGAGIVIQVLVQQIIQYQHQVQQLKAFLLELYQQVNRQESVLTSIPGISKVTAIILEAYIADVNRFPSAKQIVAYFGMNPTINRSGKSIRRASRLEKKGNPIVRQKLYMAILTIIRYKQGAIYEYYQRLLDSGKPKLVAIGAAMRKLLVIMYTILTKNVPFKDKNN